MAGGRLYRGEEGNGHDAGMINHQVVLAARPQGVAQAEHFAIVEGLAQPPEEGQILLRNLFLSVEPAMRGWIADAGNYSTPVAIGAVMRALAVAEVIQSRHPDYHPGEIVTGWFGWQEMATVGAAAMVRKVAETDLPLSLALGVLGLNGVTAVLALTRIGEPKAGDTLVVSTAAGAVGSAVGQIAGIMGCRTVGIAGGPEKAAQCRDLFGYDAAIDYKAGGLAAALDAACPDGVHIYFDNTAGAISDTVYPRLAVGARVVICGTASISAWEPWPTGPRVERHLLVKRARMQGFVLFDHMDRYEASVAQLAGWVRAGRLRYQEDILEGLESCPDALAGLYRGENKGKRVIRL
jgi:NADPH-dependent curcumin reductase